MRINISIALVDMVAGSDNSTGPAWCNNTDQEEDGGGGGGSSGSLDWTGTETSWILTSFFIGYTLFQVCVVIVVVVVESDILTWSC